MSKSAKVAASPVDSVMNSLTDLAMAPLFWAIAGCTNKAAAKREAETMRIVGIDMKSLGLNVGSTLHLF